jgi:hypothetical protein
MPMGAQGDMQKLMQVNDSSKPEIYIDEWYVCVASNWLISYLFGSD